MRDVLLGRESKDIDIVVAGSGIQLARLKRQRLWEVICLCLCLRILGRYVPL